MKKYRNYTLFLLVFLLSTAPLQAQSPQPVTASESPAVKRAREIIQLINSGNRAEGRKYVQEQYSPAFVGNRMEQHLGFFSRVNDMTRGVDISGVPEAKPAEATVLIRNKLTGEWLNLLVRRIAPR
jgi:hypothetical protein